MKKNISILGSTGSIGLQTLEVISSFPNRFKVIGLAAKNNINVLAEQVKKFSPKIVSVDTESTAEALQKKLGKTQTVIYFGSEGLIKVASHKDADTVVVAIPGSAGIIPTMEAIKLKKNIALASKEVLVAAGNIIMKEAVKNGEEAYEEASETWLAFRDKCKEKEEEMLIKLLKLRPHLWT